jgi:hypothetical protein
MTPINSGTSIERIVRSLLLSLLVDVFAVMYLYDGYMGYSQKNAVQVATLLGLPASAAPAPNPQLTSERGRKLADTVRVGEPLDKLSTELGAPSIRQADAAYFLGPGGWLKVELDQDRVRTAKWFDGPHSESDQSIQRLIGYILVVVGFAATLNLARVIATRAQLTEAGFQVTGRPLVPFEAMTALRSSSSTAGVNELDYTHNGQSATLRLDPYLYKHAAAISQAIAERKGFLR